MKSARVSVRPIRLDRLLEAIDAIDSGAVEIGDLQMALSCSASRAEDIARALNNMGLIRAECGTLVPTSYFRDFIHAWELGDGIGISAILVRSFPPYADFLRLLEREHTIPVGDVSPDAVDGVPAQNAAVNELGLNARSFDVIWRMATALGAAYLMDNLLHYGASTPPPCIFEETFLQKYRELKGGYVGVDELADALCPVLEIGLPTFERMLADLIARLRHRIKTSSSFIGQPTGRVMYVLSPRGSTPSIQRRYLSDGIHMKDQAVRVLKVSDE